MASRAAEKSACRWIAMPPPSSERATSAFSAERLGAAAARSSDDAPRARAPRSGGADGALRGRGSGEPAVQPEEHREGDEQVGGEKRPASHGQPARGLVEEGQVHSALARRPGWPRDIRRRRGA